MFNEIYKNKRVLITGDTGFKGSWLSLWLKSLGAEVYGLANGIPTEPSLFSDGNLSQFIKHYEVDIRDFEKLKKTIQDISPDIIFHLAAEAIVRTCYDQPRLAFETNALGTVNVLEAIRQTPSLKAGVFITSDKCYENVEWEFGYRETDRLGGKDPYSASKACAEIAFSSYFRSYFKDSNCFLATTRAGNVIGGGDWAKDRIIPDAIRAWLKDKPLEMRCPWATRPWQHVLEPLSGYLTLGKALLEKQEGVNGASFNFGPKGESDNSVETLIQEIIKTWSTGSYTTTGSEGIKKEATLLKLNIDRALARLEWSPTFDFEQTASFTANWYLNYQQKKIDICEFTNGQIESYQNFAKEKGLPWTR